MADAKAHRSQWPAHLVGDLPGRLSKCLQALLLDFLAARTLELEQRSTYLEASAEVASAASSILDVEQLIQQVVELIRQRFSLYYVGLFLVDEMRQFESALASFRFVPVVAANPDGENWIGERGLVTETVRRNLKNAAECEAYLCGSPGMIDASIAILTELGMKEEAIFYDKFE